MERWKGKIAIVTGASSGIGAAIAEDLALHGLIVVGLARREELLNEIKNQLPTEDVKNNFYAYKCDVTNETEVNNAFEWIKSKFGGIDILINNAGLLKQGHLATTSSTDIRQVLETNVMAVVNCTRLAFENMKDRNINGHIVLINSIAGHKVMNLGKDVPQFNIYPASKHAITAMTEIYRQEFASFGTKVKITSVSPGLVATEMTMDQIEKNENYLQPKDISDAILYCIGTPENVQVHEITIKAVGEQF